MNTKRIIVLFFTSCLLLLASFAAQAQQKYVVDKVVAVVGAEPILYSDVVKRAQDIAAQNRAQNYTSPRDPMAEALEHLLEQKLLYTRAVVDSIGLDALAPRIAEMAEQSVQNMVNDAGSIKALEDKERKPLYEIKDQMRDQIEEFYGADEMRNHLNREVKVTPGDVDRFYRRIDPDSLPIVPEQYVYAQITKLPANVELAKQRARDRLLDLRRRVIDGERFDRLAVLYSVDTGSAMRGGEYDPAPKEQWTQPFADALVKLQPGQVSGVVETEYGFHIIELLDKPAENLYHLRHILVKPTYTADEQAETLEFLDSLAGVIRAGDITFEAAALKHSDDKASRENGGLVSNQAALFRYTGDSSPKSTRTRFVRDALEQQDAQQLVRLKEGDISRPFIGGDLNMDEMAKILKLVEIIPAHRADLEQDWLDIEAMALSARQRTHYERWLDERIDEMYVRIDPMFSADDFENKRWFK